MIYNFSNTDCSNQSCIEKNRQVPRSYFVPFSSRKLADNAPLFKSRYVSDRVRVLSGEWDFKHLGCDLPPLIDTEKISFDKIFVPSSWQSEGYEKFDFLEKQFEIKPYIPSGKKSGNNYGIYRRYFEISDMDKRYILSFIKVAGCFELYINGKKAGFSKIAQSDFDITDFVILGQNELVVLVRKWSEANYLYGRPKFDLTGIAGDVLLFMHDVGSVLDYFFNFSQNDKGLSVNLGILLAGKCDNVIISVEDNGEKIFSTTEQPESDLLEIEFNADFKMYTFENPYLYDLYITATDSEGYTLECVKSKIGFRRSAVEGGVYTYNGQSVKIKGVNYSCEYNGSGKLMTIEEHYQDLLTIKKYNFNAVKFNVDLDPVLYEMCDILGLCVIKNSAVDLSMARNGRNLRILKKNKDLPFLAKHIISTQYDLLSNKTCFTLFSFGREDKNLITAPAIDFLKGFENVPLTYVDNGINSELIVSVFHPSVNSLLDEINNAEHRIIFLSEFAYSNGIGCASLKEFEDIIENAPCCMGGCISEFSDLYILCKGKDDCGLFTSLRKPYSGAENAKYVYRPLKSRLISSDKLEILNTNYFTDSSNYILNLVVRQNGKDLSSTQLKAVLEPRESRIFDVALGHIEGDMYLNIICENEITKEIYSTEQLPISYQMTEFDLAEGKGMSTKDYGGNLIVRFEGGTVTVNKEIGSIISYNLMGIEMLKPDAIRNGGNCFNTNIYRPFVRNMGNHPVYEMKLQDFEYKAVEEKGKITAIEIQTETIYKLKRKEAFIIQDMYKINPNGIIDVFSVITPLKRNLPNIDCFGKQLKLPNRFGNVTYYGRGPKDNYIDMYEYAPMGLYQTSVDKVAEDYAIAQESGNHTNVHFVTLTDNHGSGIMIMAKKNPFHLRVKPYSDNEIKRCYKENSNDYVQSGVYVDINAFVSGIGSTENGLPIAKYLVKPSEFVLQFSFVPLYKENNYENLLKNM